MGNTLQGTKIKDTYPGILKSTDNAAIGATEKIVTDGAGNDSTLSIGTASASFTGTLDLSGATVTGIDTGVATVVAGTNITVDNTDPANPVVSASGGAPAGLVVGAGASVNGPIYKSMISGSEVSNNPAVAAAGGDIVLGEGALSTTANGGWAARNVVIGTLASSTHAEGTAVGADSNAYEKGTAVGSLANAGGLSSFAGGRNARATGGESVAIGAESLANASGASALQARVTASVVDTASVKALEVQTNSTPTAGGIIMSDAGGTDRRINITSAGGLQIDSNAVGGAAITGTNTLRGLGLGNGDGQFQQWRLSYTPTSFSTAGTTVGNNTVKACAMALHEGGEVNEFTIYVTSAGTGSVTATLYKAELNASGRIIAGALEANLGTIDISSAGQKIITGIGHTLGTTVDGIYFVGIHNATGGSVGINGVASGSVGGGVLHGSMYATTMYRGNTYQFSNVATVPSDLTSISVTKSTDFPLFGLRT